MTSLSFCLHQDGGFSKLDRQKYTLLLPSIYTFFGLILTFIRNDIVLHVHVYFNPKCNENWRKAACHASSDSIQRVVRLQNFALVILPGKLIMGDIKFLSKIKYFPDRPTRLSGPYVTGTKQLFCHGLKYRQFPYGVCVFFLPYRIAKVHVPVCYLKEPCMLCTCKT